MRRYPEDAWERAMKVQEVILRALAKRSSGGQAAEIIGLADRSLRRGRSEPETMEPDRSGATKTGHFHLLLTSA